VGIAAEPEQPLHGQAVSVLSTHKEFKVVDFLIGLAFVAMILSPAIVASMRKADSADPDPEHKPTK
jgi:hypothetical protein